MTLDGSPYQGYLYAYPHKTAYRPLRPRPPLRDVWAAERRDAVFLYVHIPFCEMRCGFCNLFTRSTPPAEQVTAYLRQLAGQAEQVRAAIGPVRYAQAAIGGGTPTYLDPQELESLFGLLGLEEPVALSVETSPATATAERLAVLAAHGTHRVSMGVQSFLDSEAHAAGRPQKRAQVDRALENLRAARFPMLNLDLIYGIPGQNAQTWATSLRAALSWRPEEIYLYPLYVRPLTGLSRRHERDGEWDSQRLALYRQGRDMLRDNGYDQLSMRQFRLRDAAPPQGVAPSAGPGYCCQEDGMIGLGCGARSYTRDLHYSFDYAVGIGEVRGIIDDYLARPVSDFAFAEHGFALDENEQRLRWLLKSLLRAEGADAAAYADRFGSPLAGDFAHLSELERRGWLDLEQVRLTDEGLARSDSIGPWLVSDRVKARMATAVLR